MLPIMQNNEWLIKETLLTLEICNAMLFPILTDIAFIPVEPVYPSAVTPKELPNLAWKAITLERLSSDFGVLM